MLRLLTTRLLADERGALLSAEYLILVTLLVIGLIAGWAAIRDAVFEKLDQQAQAIAGTEGPGGGPPPGFPPGGPPGGGPPGGPPFNPPGQEQIITASDVFGPG